MYIKLLIGYNGAYAPLPQMDATGALCFVVPALVEDPEVSTQFYVFYDWGETWQNVTADFSTKVASAGGGARIQLTRYVELDLEALGRFNVYPSGGQNTGVSSINGLGLYWRLLGRF